MKAYVNQSALIAMSGRSVRTFGPLPPCDVRIGRANGWDPDVRIRGPVISFIVKPVLVLAGVKEAVELLGMSKARFSELRKDPESGFPAPFAMIVPHKVIDRQVKGWNGCVPGWEYDTLHAWKNDEGAGYPSVLTGRPRGSGDYASLPRCGRPKTGSVHGKNQPCKAVCRKVEGEWLDACALHLTDEENRAYGLI